MDNLIRALPGILRQAGEAPEVAEAAALVAWRHVAGEQLRGCAVPFRLYRKTLVVAVSDHNWQKQLEKLSGQLLFGLNSVLGQAVVTYLEFRIDPITVQNTRAEITHEAHEPTSESDALRSADGLLQAAASIPDPNLRRRFLLAAGSCLNAAESK